MSNKKLFLLIVAAAVLGGAAYFLRSDSRPAPARLNGRALVPGLSVGEVARIEVGNKLVLASSADGWKVESLHGYPADREKIVENLMKLVELKVGQVARGRKLGAETAVTLKDASGKELASLKLGDKHMKKASGQAAMYGGSYPDGRYAAFEGETVLVKDTLDAFDGDAKKWCNPRIASFPSSDVKAVKYSHAGETVELEKGTNSTWVLKGLGPKEELDTSKTYSLDSALAYLDFASVADPSKEATYGFATGAVYTATLKNGIVYKATVGNKSGSDSYVKLSASYTPSGTNKTEIAANEKTVREFNAKTGKWIYTISSYSADNLSKARKDLVKAKEEPKKDEKKPDAKKDDKKGEAKK